MLLPVVTMCSSYISQGVLEHHVEAFPIMLKNKVIHLLDIFGVIYFILQYISFKIKLLI